jgi:hypothetical protein
MDLDCYFFVDLSVPENDRTMSVLCTDCHDNKMPDVGWFYKGSKEGYGPYEFKCCICGRIVHEAEKDDTDEEKAEATSEDPRG